MYGYRQENPKTAMTAMTLLRVSSFTTCFFKFYFPLNLDLLATQLHVWFK